MAASRQKLPLDANKEADVYLLMSTPLTPTHGKGTAACHLTRWPYLQSHRQGDPRCLTLHLQMLRQLPRFPATTPVGTLTVADPDGAGVPHVSVAGGTYTVLVSGAQTAGRYCLVDMLVPAGGGPPPHRHDFEEMFTLLEGELEFTFRGKSYTVRAGATVNVPANAPHAFKNVSSKTARMLCMCTPAGQDEFFLAVGFPVEGRASPPPKPTPEEVAEKGKLIAALLPKYRTEMVKM